MNTEGQTAATADKRSIVQVFEGISKPEQIIDGLRRRDASYIKGVIQHYERFPINPLLVEFLRKALQSLCKIQTPTT